MTNDFEKWWSAYPVPGEYDGFDACDQLRWKALASDAYTAGQASQAKEIERLLVACKEAAEQIRRCDYTPARSTLLAAIAKGEQA